jgi:hypothetical protein
LADRNVDTRYALTFLINDGVDRNSCFTCLTIANDQLTLTTADRHHGVNRFQTGLQWLRNGLTSNNAGRNLFDRRLQFCVDWAFAIDRLTECINNTTA